MAGEERLKRTQVHTVSFWPTVSESYDFVKEALTNRPAAVIELTLLTHRGHAAADDAQVRRVLFSTKDILAIEEVE